LSLSAVSARLKTLEEIFGTELCRRSHKGIELTPAGLRLQAHAHDLLEKATHVSEDVAEFGTLPRGLVRLAANTTAVTEHLPDLLAEFLAAHPRIDVALVEGASADVLGQLRDGHADLGICTPGPAATDLCSLPFRSDRMVLVVSRAHPWAGRGTIDFHECLLENHVCLQRSAAMYSFLVQRARDQGRKLKGRIHVAGFDAMARLVGRGVGVGIMPESSAMRLRQAEGLGVLVLNDGWADIPLFVCMRAPDELSPSSRALFAALQAPPGLPPG